MSEVSKATRDAVWERDHGRCAVCGLWVWGCRGVDYSLHHRRPRAMGGSVAPETNSPANLVLLHGSGTTECHGQVESHRQAARDAGWLVRQRIDPATVPMIHAVHGQFPVYLWHDATWARTPGPGWS